MKYKRLSFLMGIVILIILSGGCKMKELASNSIAELDYFYSNPSDVDNIGDPYVLKANDGFYYMFCTSADNGYFCWKSADLIYWTDKKMAYKRAKNSWAMTCFWAPEVIESDGVYYMYYTAKNKEGSLRIGVAISSAPDGPYEEALDKPLFDFGYAAIDAHVFIDGDGKKYLYYSRDCSENLQNKIQVSEIYGVSLDDNMLSVDGEPVLLTTPSQVWETGSKSPVWNEGPEMIKHNGIYYLTYSGNCFSSRAYSVGYATSDAPLGTFTKYSANPILTAGSYPEISGSGHHSFTTSPDGKELFMVYHTHTDPNVGGGNRQVNIDRIVFTETGELHVNGPTLSYQPAPSNNSLTNVAVNADITYGKKSVPLLKDNIFTIHKKDKDYDWIADLNDNHPVKVKITFPKEQTISSILVYRGVTDGADFSYYKVEMEDRYFLPDCPLSEEKIQRAAITAFEPISVKELALTFFPKENTSKIALSEIMILGYE